MTIKLYSVAAVVQRREANNPLLDNTGLPRFSAITTKHLVPGIKQVVQEFDEGLQELEKDLEAPGNAEKTWASVFDRLEILQFPMHYSWMIVTYLNKVKSSPELRKAYYEALISGSQKLNDIQLRIINSSLRVAKNGGVELEGETKIRFNDIQLQLANHYEKFSINVIDSTNAYSLLLTNKTDIQGLPETTRRLLAANAVAGANQRLEFARILGYKNFAELSISKNMAGSVERVWNFINVLRARSYPVAQRELKTLQWFAESYGQEGELQQWDKDYWDELQSMKLFSVLSGLFQLSSILFGITVKPADDKVEVWHPDVKVFDVYDEKAKSNLLGKKPVAFLACNQFPPVGSVPSLMSFSEVKSLFHEFGHALQHMLTTVPYAMAAGLNNIEWDAVEFPSQFMEKWVYDNNTIPLISGHYQAGEPLPQNIFAQVLKASHYGGGSIMLRQMFLAALDLKLHTRIGEREIISYPRFSSTESWTRVVEKIAGRFSVMKQLPDDCVLCTFLHIFSGGYAAGYYSYEWAEVLAQDAFGAFEDIGLQNRNAISKIGRRCEGLGTANTMLPFKTEGRQRAQNYRPVRLKFVIMENAGISSEGSSCRTLKTS
ncbi:uncharacterized protein LOC144690298 [Cetorhinus maximus]